MKSLLFIVAVCVLTSCSSSRYAAHFQKSDGGFGYHEMAVRSQPVHAAPVTENFVASASKEIGIITEAPAAMKVAALKKLKTQYQNLSKREKKAFRKELVREVKKMRSSPPARSGMTGDPRTWDHDLQLAAIFATVGIVALIIGTTFFWVIGAVSLIIGVVFGVKWLTQN